MSDWIDVKEDLPVHARVLADPLTVNGKQIEPMWVSDPVLAVRNGKVTMTCLEWFDDRRVIHGYTHWMPLPEAPKDSV